MSESDVLNTISYPRDLFRYLGEKDIEQDQRLCVYFCPYKKKYRSVFEKAVSPACVDIQINPICLDRISAPGNIMNEILKAIFIAGIVVVDISERNANVMYELGLCHGLKRIHEVVILSREPLDKLPFDITGVRCFEYTSSKKGLEELSDKLKVVFREVIEKRNSVLQYGGLGHE